MFKIYSINEIQKQLENLGYIIDAFLFCKFMDSFSKFSKFDLKNAKVVYFQDSIKIKKIDNDYTYSFDNYKKGRFLLIDFNYWEIIK